MRNYLVDISNHHSASFNVVQFLIQQFFLHKLDIGRLARMSILDTEVDGSNPGSNMLFP